MAQFLISIVGWGLLFLVSWGIKWRWSMKLHAEESFVGTLRERLPLQRSKITKKTIISIIGVLIGMGILGAIVFAVTSSKSESGALSSPPVRVWARALWAGCLPSLLCTQQLWHVLYFRRYFYDADALTITIRKGVIAQKEVTLPFSQVTDVYLDQDIFDVLFGLYDIHISTATQESGQEAHIDGVCRKDAMELKELILNGIGKGERANKAIDSDKK